MLNLYIICINVYHEKYEHWMKKIFLHIRVKVIGNRFIIQPEIKYFHKYFVDESVYNLVNYV